MHHKTSTVNTASTVSQIVRDNYRTADVFRHFGINYCCKGNISLQEACSQHGIDQQELENALHTAATVTPLNKSIQFDNWKLDFLIDYLINIHHAYLNQTLPALEAGLTRFAEGHKKEYSELQQVLPVFMQLSALLQEHVKKEESSIFPYLKQMINAYNRRETYGALFVKTMRMPLQHILEKEHKQSNDLLQQLRKTTNNYTVRDGACTNYGVYLHKLAELDADLVQHKHLENNILFPRVLQMEKELLQL